jgi:tetratricopeptide (TPR) repeat protein
MMQLRYPWRRVPFGRSVLLALSMLSACAATDPSGADPQAAASSDTENLGGVASVYLQGRYAEEQGDLQAAANLLLRADELAPGNAEIGRQAFLAALLAGRPEAVRLARQNQDTVAAQLLLAGEDAKAGAWQHAERRFTALPRQGIAAPLWPLVVAWSQFGAGRVDVALATLQPYAQADAARRAIYIFHAGLMNDLAGREAEAGRDYRAAQNAFGAPYLEVVRALASWQARNGDLTGARDTIATLAQSGNDLSMVVARLQQNPAERPVRNAVDGIAESYTVLAAMLHQQDNNELSALLLRLALRLRPDQTTARLLASEVLAQGSSVDAELGVLAPVAKSDPLRPVVELRIAELQDRGGNADGALHTLSRLEADMPAQPEPWALQGAILREQHRWAEAAAAYDNAIAHVSVPSRANWSLFYERGIAEERSHAWPKAEADFQRALQLSPNQPFVLNYLGYCWTEQGRNLPAARRMIDQAATERPNDGAIIDSAGWIALRERRVGAAVDQLEKAVELEPEDATINGHLGDAYWAAGRKLEALYQWQRALSLNPEAADASSLRAKLHEAEAAEASPRAQSAQAVQSVAGSATADVKTQP